ncbi:MULTISPECIES: SDR family oxidoreductase [Phaeodactylibacter]|jgi:NAD(P)-dependent dehydrogenase (short-subunit alcohol dehydrogenase family)|uniref:SDR family oxidoreductase n=1 Tax=Phaeodactylibacter TaxID=1564515 RepID=UPI0024A83A91|nr:MULTISPECIES: SDR family oxidoreductase [Phaeodactylibacter]MCI4649805.1 SDR family oxidoreductase [Phaeodactylibacter sp.]MCI5093162.1 SDR family oxidoreductase [Phaeodactylibacter sp.]
METKLNGKTALITGGSKGIGLGVAEAMVKNGMHVAVTSREQTAADAAAEKLTALGPGKAIGIAADVRDMVAQENAVKRVIEEWGQLDVAIANAGVGHFAPIEEMTAEQWNAVIDTNLTGVFYTTKASIPELKKTKGYLITIASLAGTNFFPSGSAYNASKFGLVGFTQAVMLDLRQDDVKVTTIMPGSVATYFNDHTPNEKDAWKIQPEDMGQMVMDLLNMHPRTLPSKVEVRPTKPPKK